MAATNPALAPGAEPVEGDNLTPFQAKLILAAMSSDPDVFLDAAEDGFDAAGYASAEDATDELLTFLSTAAGEPDDDEATSDEDGADPSEMEGQ